MPSSDPDQGFKPDELKVFISNRESECDLCKRTLAPGGWITLVQEAGARCLACADLDELVFLPSGNTALTRRARAHSALAAVVLKWSRSRKRYERQGLLVQEAALHKAEEECLADGDARERQRERAASRRAELDTKYVAEFAARTRELYPGCPASRAKAIAEHACLKYSGRAGRSAGAKELDEKAVRLAVLAHIRHHETNYDALLGSGIPRDRARAEVKAKIDQAAARWQKP
jgi:hypothetical protein